KLHTVKSQLKTLSGTLQGTLQDITLQSDTKSLVEAVQSDIKEARSDETDAFSKLQTTLVAELETLRSNAQGEATKEATKKVDAVRAWLPQMAASIQELHTVKSQLKVLSDKLQSELQGVAEARAHLTTVQSDIARSDETKAFSKFRATLSSALETLHS